MTIEQLASALETDALTEAPRRYRHYCTRNRCYRAAAAAIAQFQRQRAMQGQGHAAQSIDVEQLAREMAELEQRESAGILIGIGLVLLQAVLGWLVRRALDRLVAESRHG
ncbi:hypothetical protein Pan44_26860 [Caulifigura coniformis]|uniref:Uncharacterized protein n=1 Tax=Caulifigura coniformis TaxID=2527983 RepID=A0A517SEU4_9PLAN|nr:hypothetical protein [Caulifigura coniformis]QDT54651.1 hypothetical protein Pan44_26860 [Caulifigura coniformis]